MQEVQLLQIPFYKTKAKKLEARLLLPLKTIAYGVPSHVFCPYFQMSAEMARECCQMFDVAIKLIYLDEFL